MQQTWLVYRYHAHPAYPATMLLDALVLPGMAMLYKLLARVLIQNKVAHMGKQQCLTNMIMIITIIIINFTNIAF